MAAMSCATRAASSTWLALPPKSGRERAAKWYYFHLVSFLIFVSGNKGPERKGDTVSSSEQQR